MGSPVDPCPECGVSYGYPTSHLRHRADCSIGLERLRRYRAEKDLRGVLAAVVDARREDVEFMERLRRRIEQDATILDRLAES